MQIPEPLVNNTAIRLFEQERTQFGVHVDAARRMLDKLISRATSAIRPTATLGAARQLTIAVFRDTPIRFSQKDRSTDFTLTGTLLNQAGNCLGRATLFLLAARRAGLPVRPLLFEGHIACAVYHGGQWRHCEPGLRLTLPSQRLTAASHRGDRGRQLTDDELLAVHLANQAVFTQIPAGAFEAALASLEQALRWFPSYHGGRLNLAILLADIGRFDDSADALDHFFELNPGPQYEAVAQQLQLKLSRECRSVKSGRSHEIPNVQLNQT